MSLPYRLILLPVGCIAATSFISGYIATRPEFDTVTIFALILICTALTYCAAKVLLRRMNAMPLDPTEQLVRELYCVVAKLHKTGDWWLVSRVDTSVAIIRMDGDVAVIDHIDRATLNVTRHYRITSGSHVTQRVARGDMSSLTHDRLQQLLDMLRSSKSRDINEPTIAVRTRIL